MLRFAPAYRPISRLTTLLTLGGAMLLGTWADAAPLVPRSVIKTYFKESPGSTATQGTAFDTKIKLTYTGGLLAQRVGTIMGADRIVVLDGGAIVGQGTHQELMATCETYREIVYSQLSTEEAA